MTKGSAQNIRRMNRSTRTSKGLAKEVIKGDDEQNIELVDKPDMEKALLGACALMLTQAIQHRV